MAKAKKKTNALSFEELMASLEKTVEGLESDTLSLEDAIETYQKGVDLAKLGHERLAEAERRIEAVTQSGKIESVNEGDLLDDENDE